MTAITTRIRAAQTDSVRVIHLSQKQANDAYLIYAAMKRAERDEPALLSLPMWNSLKAAAYAWFLNAFEVQQ